MDTEFARQGDAGARETVDNVAELTPEQRAWVADYDREDRRLRPMRREPTGFGWFGRLIKRLLIDLACRGLVPAAWVAAAFERWPALRWA